MEHYCDACKHNRICKYKDEFEAKREEIKNLLENVKIEDVKIEDNPIIVNIKCKYYWDTIGTIAFPGTVIPYDTKYAINTISTNPCEGCPNNPALSDTPIIGDSPCQWCQHSPTRVTCENGNVAK